MLSETKSRRTGKTLIQTLFFLLMITQICLAQWYQQNSETTKNLTAVTFIDDNSGFAVGDSGIILHTTNAGAIWEQQTSGTIPLNDVFFNNANKGWIIGSSWWPRFVNILLHTTDGGPNWIEQILDTSFSLNSIFFLNENIGWIAGAIYADSGYNDNTFPIILKTTNGGSNWQLKSVPTSLPYGYYLNDVFFIDANIGFAVGGGGNIGGAYGSIFKTTDGGENWVEQIALSANYKSIAFLDEQNGIAVGRWGYSGIPTIVRTTDGGINWSNVFQQWPGGSFNSVALINSNYAWVVGGFGLSEGTILFSSDNGQNWSPQGEYLSILNDIYFINSSTGWAVGDNGTILHTTNGGVSFVDEEQINTIPTDFLLSQNYPNPFNPSTKIKYSVSQSSKVVLKVFDFLGNEIETLINEEKPAGSYELTWVAANLPSGVYFYQLKAGSLLETKKMILLK